MPDPINIWLDAAVVLVAAGAVTYLSLIRHMD